MSGRTMSSTEHRARFLMTAACRAVERNDQVDASNLYRKAGNYYKLARQWTDAGIAYRHAGQLKAPVNDNTGPSPTTSAPLSTAVGLLLEASHCFLKADAHHEAVTCLQTVADLLTDAGEFFTAAGHYASLGQLVVPRDMDAGIGYFEEAARLYEIGESAGHYNIDVTWLLVAAWEARRGHYTRAIAIFEEVGQRNTADSAWVEGYFAFPNTDARIYADQTIGFGAYFPAVLCHLLRDGPLAAKIAVARYEDRMPEFRSSSQCSTLLRAMGYAQDTFTVKSVEALLRADSGNGMSPIGYTGSYWQYYKGDDYCGSRVLIDWSRIMLGRAVQLLRNAEHERARCSVDPDHSHSHDY